MTRILEKRRPRICKKKINMVRLARSRRGEMQTQTMWSSEKSKTNWGRGMGNQRDPQVEKEVQKAKKKDREEEPEEEEYVKERWEVSASMKTT